jgi:hypothetical protein
MYIRPVHAELDHETLHALIRANPLGLLTTAIPHPTHATIQTSHVPFVLDVPDDSPLEERKGKGKRVFAGTYGEGESAGQSDDPHRHSDLLPVAISIQTSTVMVDWAIPAVATEPTTSLPKSSFSSKPPSTPTLPPNSTPPPNPIPEK